MERERALWSGSDEKRSQAVPQLCPSSHSIQPWTERAGGHREVTPLSWGCHWGSGLLTDAVPKGRSQQCLWQGPGHPRGAHSKPPAGDPHSPLCAPLLKLTLWIIYYILVSWINYTYKWRQKNSNKCFFWLWQTGMCESLIKYLTDCSI